MKEEIFCCLDTHLEDKDGERIPLDAEASNQALFVKYNDPEVKVVIDGGKHLILCGDDFLAGPS